MPVTHLINVVLRPGIQSIQVQYKYQSAETWTNYNEGQRIPGGVDVKFTVTAYPNFTLTEWSAYYSDEYDDTVVLPLSGVTGESAWTFTMPSADVYIRCEASNYSAEYSNAEIFTLSVSNRLVYIVSFLTANQFVNSINSTLLSLGYPVLSSGMVDIITNNFIQNVFQSWYIYYFVNFRRIEIWREVFISPNIPFNELNNCPTHAVSWVSADNSSNGFGDWNNLTFVEQLEIDSQFPLSAGYWENRASTVLGYIFPSVNMYSLNSPSSGIPAIRYVMSPENSGEVDASAPSELTPGATEFTFKWRIKVGYEFKRLTPFAVGDGSLEDDVVYSLQYDGDTRTYTFIVSSIPDWAKGVRVLIETIMTGDPSSPIGDNGSDAPVGGNGTFDDTSDEVPLPAIPNGVSAPDTGFVTLFRPTISQIKDLSNYMWSNISEFIENLQKIFTNPMDYIISLASFPVTPDVGPNKNIYVGNFLTNIQMPPITRQFYEFNCGTINVAEYFGSFLDYAPNTRARIMLPFIGDADLSINEIMGKTLHLWYRIDLLSGSCVAVLTIDNSVYYQWTGNCSIQIPVTASDFSRLYAGIARVGVTAAAVAAGGAYLGALSSAASGWNAANAGWHSVSGDFGQGYSPSPNFGVPALPPSYGQLSTDLSTDSGPQLNMGDYVNYTPPMQIPSKKSRALAAAAGGSFIGHNMMNAIPRVQHAGGMSGNIGIMGNRTPFIVLEYPNVSMPENYKHVFGYPSNMYKVLGNLAGYTKCKQVFFESTKATDDEYEMVIEALKGGVYL